MREVTVLMPVFNGERFLGQAIDSILAQTYTDFELLIINDGSTDSTEMIVNSYCDSRIRYIASEHNVGLVNTLNRGIDIANGTFIARMDADDVAFPSRLEKQVSYLKFHPDVDVLGCQTALIDDSGQLIGERSYPLDHDRIKLESLCCCPMPHPGVLFRKARLVSNNLWYDARQRFTEDYELWQRALRILRFANSEEKLLQYRLNAKQVSQVHSGPQEAEAQQIRLNYLEELQLNDMSEEASQLFLAFLDGKAGATNRNVAETLLDILEDVWEANGRYRVFHEELLGEMMALQLDRITGIFTDKTNRFFSRYKTHPLFRFSRLSTIHQLKLVCKEWICKSREV